MAPIVRIIPERTIDAWTSSAILDREPGALVWAPTPPAQAVPGTRPWHLPIGAFDPPGRLIVLENKAMIGPVSPHCFPKVGIELDQLARLIDLEIDGLPIFYGLPGLCELDSPTPSQNDQFEARALFELRPHFLRWQRLVRPLELFALRPVVKAVAANRRTVTLNALSFVGFPPLRALLSDTRAGQWSKDLPGDLESRAMPLLPPFRLDRIVEDAVWRVACMGPATAAIMKVRLLDLYAQPNMQARMADLQPEHARVDVHLNRTIWVVLPPPQRKADGGHVFLQGTSDSSRRLSSRVNGAP